MQAISKKVRDQASRPTPLAGASSAPALKAIKDSPEWAVMSFKPDTHSKAYT